jgi:hypothetical protein
MSWADRLLHVNRWSRQPSGLIVPTEIDRPVLSGAEAELLGADLGAPFLMVVGGRPSSFEQMRVFIDEESVGLTPSTPAEVEGLAAQLSFETPMVGLAQMAAAVFHIRGDTAAQIELAKTIFASRTILAGIEKMAREVGDHLEVFPEQNIASLQRLLVLSAREGEIRPREQEIFDRALVGVAAFSAEENLGAVDGAEERARWLAYLIKNGTYNRVEESLGSMIRPQILLGDLARTEARMADPDHCDVDAWLEEDLGFGLADQFTLAMAIFGVSRAFEEEAGLRERAVIGAAILPELITRLGGDQERGLDLLSAPREWFAAEFSARPDAGTATAAWDRIPFEMRPLLRLDEGALLLLSPRAIESWVGDGFYHRALAAARTRGDVPRFQRFYGRLVEDYVLTLLMDVHPEPAPAGVGRISAEQRYGRKGSEKKSPDVGFDGGTDIVLFEVTSGRFTLDTVLDGSPEAAMKDLGRLLFAKASQLSRRIDDLIAGEWTLPGSDQEHVQRIWPVVVTADVLQNEHLWDEMREQLENVLGQPKVQRLTVLDLADVELLAALVERGHGLIEVIAGKAGGLYAELDLRRYVDETPGLEISIRASMLDRRWLEEVHRGMASLGFEDEMPEGLQS